MMEISSYKQNFVHHLKNLDIKTPSLTLFPVLTAVLTAEIAIFTGYQSFAMWIYLLTLLFCLFTPLRYKSTTRLLAPFGLLPLFRLVNMGMPTIFELTLLTLPFIYLPVLVAIYFIIQGHDSITIRTNPKIFLIASLPISVLSAVLAAGEFLIVSPEALIPELSLSWFLTIGVIMILGVSLVEELLFRGVLQEVLKKHFGSLLGIMFTSFLFGAMHSIYGSPLQIAFAVFLGLVYGSIYHVSDSIELVVLLHGLLNIFVFAIFPIY